MTVNILGISSAAKTLEVALVSDGALLAQRSLSQNGLAAEDLVSYIDDVLKKSVPLDKLSAIAVTSGPGSYGGLRGGLAVAKSIAHVLQISIAPVSTLEAIAYNFVNVDGMIFVALSACREEYNVALFGAGQNTLNRVTDDFVVKKSAIVKFLKAVSGEIYFVGDEKICADVRELSVHNIRIANPADSAPKAANVALIGEKKFKNKETEDFVTALPGYSHTPNIREYRP